MLNHISPKDNRIFVPVPQIICAVSLTECLCLNCSMLLATELILWFEFPWLVWTSFASYLLGQILLLWGWISLQIFLCLRPQLLHIMVDTCITIHEAERWKEKKKGKRKAMKPLILLGFCSLWKHILFLLSHFLIIVPTKWTAKQLNFSDTSFAFQ